VNERKERRFSMCGFYSLRKEAFSINEYHWQEKEKEKGEKRKEFSLLLSLFSFRSLRLDAV